jgi:hypothetical protein
MPVHLFSYEPVNYRLSCGGVGNRIDYGGGMEPLSVCGHLDGGEPTVKPALKRVGIYLYTSKHGILIKISGS